MASNYPGALDVLDEAVVVTLDHSDVADAVEAVQATLGTNPQGSAASVKARLDAVEQSALGVFIQWDGSNWKYKGNTVTARPTLPANTRCIFVDPLGSSTGPAWATANLDLLMKVAT